MSHTSILIKIRQIARSINLESKKTQKEYGVSIPQVLCMSFLKQSTNYQATHREITRFLHLNSSTVSGIINRLEKRGYVARLPKSGDKRMTTIALTALGERSLAQVPPLLHERLSKKLNVLPADDLNSIEKALDQLVNLLDIAEMPSEPIISSDDKLSPSK